MQNVSGALLSRQDFKSQPAFVLSSYASSRKSVHFRWLGVCSRQICVPFSVYCIAAVWTLNLLPLADPIPLQTSASQRRATEPAVFGYNRGDHGIPCMDRLRKSLTQPPVQHAVGDTDRILGSVVKHSAAATAGSGPVACVHKPVVYMKSRSRL